MFFLVFFLCNAGLITTDVALKLEEMRHLDKLGDLLIPSPSDRKIPHSFSGKTHQALYRQKKGMAQLCPVH